MLQEIEQLLILQDRDQRIAALQRELKRAPLERKALEEKLAKAKLGAESTKAKLREAEVRKKNLEVEAQGKRDQIGRFKTQQMQTRKNEEYQALANEIAHFEKEVVAIEDRELEAMEVIEALRPEVAAAEKEAVEAQRLVEVQIADLEAKIATLGKQLEEVKAERTGLAQPLEEDLLRVYDRLFVTKEGNAIVPLEGEVCQGCHMKLTTQTALRVKAGLTITHCEQCGRILYRS